MIDFSNSSLEKIIVHKVGNKSRSEEIRLSKSLLSINGNIKDLLSKYFLSPFKSNEFYNFFHDTNISLNEVFNYVDKIFTAPQSMLEQSENLAKHLYEKTTHPKIKSGEFYIVYIKNCLVKDEIVDAIGLFKSESKETFLKVYPTTDNFRIEGEEGININKLDKGCIIYNIDTENGYLMSIVDNVNKSIEAQYWRDEFLHIKECEDNYYYTQKAMQMCKNFVVERMPETFEIDRATQAEMLNKSLDFFKEKTNFSIEEYSQEVIAQQEIIDAFHTYKKDFEFENAIILENNFSLSENAIVKQSKNYKSVLKLDKNFTLYIHGNRQNITCGFDDEKNKKFYQLYFDYEN